MTHTYSITFCAYDGGYPTPGPGMAQPNPLVWIHGTIDGIATAYIPVEWAGIQQAFAVNGQGGVQSYLAPVMLNAAIRGGGLFFSFTDPPQPVPVFTSTSIPAPVTGMVFPNSTVICTQGLVGTWTE
jgi:hypothetical protein